MSISYSFISFEFMQQNMVIVGKKCGGTDLETLSFDIDWNHLCTLITPELGTGCMWGNPIWERVQPRRKAGCASTWTCLRENQRIRPLIKNQYVEAVRMIPDTNVYEKVSRFVTNWEGFGRCFSDLWFDLSKAKSLMIVCKPCGNIASCASWIGNIYHVWSDA